MFFKDIGYLGSLMEDLPEPTSVYIDGMFAIKEWKFSTGTNDHFLFVQKNVVSRLEKTSLFIDKLSLLFPKHIVSGSKRLLSTFNSNASFSYYQIALSLLYMSCIKYNKQELFTNQLKNIAIVLKDEVSSKYNYNTIRQNINLSLKRIKNCVDPKTYEELNKWEEMDEKI